MFCHACGGGSAPSAAPAPPPSAAPAPPSPTVATWGAPAKITDAGRAVTDAYSGIYPPQVQLAGSSDGTAFALWERMEPATVAAARFVSGVWESPVEGAGQGRLDSWLAVNRSGQAVVTWGEDASREEGVYASLWTWSRRFQPGQGWSAPERIQSIVSYFDHPPTLGGFFWSPPLVTGVVLADMGAAQAFWRRSYAYNRPSGRSGSNGPDVHSATFAAGVWAREVVVAEDREVTFFRVSGTTTLVLWSHTRGSPPYQPQVFEAGRGWQPVGKAGMPRPRKVVLARGGFAMVPASSSDPVVMGLAPSGDLGPAEVLIADYKGETYDICGNESGVLGFVRSDADRVVLKYRGATDPPPTFTTASIPTTGRPVSEPVTCLADAAGRVLVVWRSEQSTLGDRYVPGTGFEGTKVIGPGFATTPGLAEDGQGNILAAWAMLTADKRVEIWWNRLRVP